MIPFCAMVQALEELSNNNSLQLKWMGVMFPCVFVQNGVPCQVWNLNVCTYPYMDMLQIMMIYNYNILQFPGFQRR